MHRRTTLRVLICGTNRSAGNSIFRVDVNEEAFVRQCQEAHAIISLSSETTIAALNFYPLDLLAVQLGDTIGAVFGVDDFKAELPIGYPK